MAKDKSGLGTTSAPIPAPAPPSKPSNAGDAKDFSELRQYMKDTYGVKVAMNLSNANFELVRDEVASAEEILKEFPKAKPYLKWIGGELTKKNAYASMSFPGGMLLNGDKATDDAKHTGLAKFKYNYNNDLKGEFHPKGTTYKNIFTHEAGHLLERALIAKKYPGKDFWSKIDAINAWNKCELSKELVMQAYKTVKAADPKKWSGNAIKKMRRDVSKYALGSFSETLAECVADYTANKQNAKPLSKEVWKLLKKELM